jgi:hypothetical protein
MPSLAASTAPVLYHIRSAVRPEKRPPSPPPNLFAKFERDAFWDDPAQLPTSVRVV